MILICTCYFRNTVIGRDRDGNDVMADGSINIKTTALNLKSVTGREQYKEHIGDNKPEVNKFDITACIGSPEKLPSTEESSTSNTISE